MTFPAPRRPGGPTVPKAVTSGTSEAFHLQFLSAEERATANLMAMFQDARLELETFLREGDLTSSDAVFYRHLLAETNRIGSKVDAKSAQWVSDVIPEAFSAGHLTHSHIVVPQAAIEALSRSTLELLTRTSTGIRTAVRSAIAQGILQSLPADELRARILKTGLSNIPHWPNVEYRAGVIARTETMRAYNEGAQSGMLANGAYVAEWIASPDEAVCSICAPRDGKRFLIADPPSPDAYGWQLDRMPDLPAHPRCRCTSRAVYRDDDGRVLREGIVDEAPELPRDAMGGDLPPHLPPSAGEIEDLAERRWATTRLAKDDISNQMLGFVDGRTIEYDAALKGGRAPVGGDLAGFENRLKTLDSYVRKVKDTLTHEPGLTAKDGVDSVHDLLRFTSRFNGDEFTARTLDEVGRLKRDGWRRTKWKPTWDKGGYQGINSNWTRGKVEIEMQFHTPASFANKERAHEIYRKLETMTAADSDYASLVDEMAGIFDQAKPSGWDLIMRLA